MMASIYPNICGNVEVKGTKITCALIRTEITALTFRGEMMAMRWTVTRNVIK